MTYTQTFPIEFDPTAEPEAVVMGPQVRFTVLTSRLLRIEFSPTNTFEDRPSQAFWYRRQPAPEFEAEAEDTQISIDTEYLQLKYLVCDNGFSPDTLQIRLKQKNTVWVYGTENTGNLRGTTRTLDNVDGKITLEEGLISRSGWAVYDDTSRLVFNEEGWLTNRNAPSGYQDFYFFGYGDDYYGCLEEFGRIAGPAPLLPRWALGNWWSRYWAYSEEELLGLMDEFRTNNVPLSVCIVDMDWHITNTGNASSGWTGYTWNRELFPDPQRFIAGLHDRGLITALNLHPATGIYPHEAQYRAMAEHMGIDPDTQEPVPFAITDPHFARGYFEILHHPEEANGIDFWWTDWQQGTASDVPGLDPLWWLNHLHFYDLGRVRAEGALMKRPFIFSRWGGLGNHRYPIGFSGDTIVSWESLQFQPYFTATAANVNYGWWSHDIGGHMGGVEDPELYTRWIQYGVFSPILRMHCTNNPFHERRPWGYDAEVQRITSDSMQLRHALIPYLYTMAWRNQQTHIPLIRPMYFDHPNLEQAYHCPDQYFFGSEMIAAPVINPIDSDTRHSRQAVWLPEGDWFNFFDGLKYSGDRWHTIYSKLAEIPVFAKSGAIVPLAPRVGWGGVENPDTLELHLFPGADNQFVLYEDDDHLSSSLTPFKSHWTPQSWTIEIGAVKGGIDHLPEERVYAAHFRGVKADAVASAQRNGAPVDLKSEYLADTMTWVLSAGATAPTDTLRITLSTSTEDLRYSQDLVLQTSQKLVNTFRMDTWIKQGLFQQLPALVDHPEALAHYALALNERQMQALLETITGAGCIQTPTRRTDEDEILFWNNAKTNRARYRLVAADLNNQSSIQNEPLPEFGVLTLGEKVLSMHKGSQSETGRLSVADWFATLGGRVRTDFVVKMDAVVQFEIGDVQAYVTLGQGNNSLTFGKHAQPDVTLASEADVWLAMINGEETADELFLTGKLNISGDMELALMLGGVIQIAPQSKYLANNYRLEVNYMDILTLQLGGNSSK